MERSTIRSYVLRICCSIIAALVLDLILTAHNWIRWVLRLYRKVKTISMDQLSDCAQLLMNRTSKSITTNRVSSEISKIRFLWWHNYYRNFRSCQYRLDCVQLSTFVWKKLSWLSCDILTPSPLCLSIKMSNKATICIYIRKALKTWKIARKSSDMPTVSWRMSYKIEEPLFASISIRAFANNYVLLRVCKQKIFIDLPATSHRSIMFPGN